MTEEQFLEKIDAATEKEEALEIIKEYRQSVIADFEVELYKHFNSIQPHRITQSDISEIAERLKVK